MPCSMNWQQELIGLSKPFSTGTGQLNVTGVFCANAHWLLISLPPPHSQQEMDHYCPLVSPDCYCIVEDTKMSRWASTGPLESVKKFMAGKHGKHFTVVRHGYGGDTACSHVNPSTIPWFTQDAPGTATGYAALNPAKPCPALPEWPVECAAGCKSCSKSS